MSHISNLIFQRAALAKCLNPYENVQFLIKFTAKPYELATKPYRWTRNYYGFAIPPFGFATKTKRLTSYSKVRAAEPNRNTAELIALTVNTKQAATTMISFVANLYAVTTKGYGCTAKSYRSAAKPYTSTTKLYSNANEPK